jgi:hypothetical protein
VPTRYSATRQKRRAHIKTSLILWKDGDPDIPILKEAKAEYAKLRYFPQPSLEWK